MIFLSTHNMNGKTLNPRIPSNYFTKNGFEDSKIKRVCFAPDIDHALMALSQKCTNMELYVHCPVDESKLKIKHPSISEVPDSKITKEIWVLNDTEIKCIGKIKVIKDKGLDGYKFKYGNKEAELYDWEWKWMDKYTNINESYNTSSKFSDVMDVVNSLTLSERHNIAPNECSSHRDSYSNSPNCIYRKVYKNGKDNMGFIELHSFNKDEAYIAVAVNPKYRGEGLSKLMVTDAINSPIVKNRKELKKLLWSCFKANIASNKQAKDLNFTLYNSNKHWNEYEFILNKSLNESYTIDTLPDVLYFSSPKKINELKGKVFLSPYIGISSMFVVDNKDIKSKNGYSCNLGYKEWGYVDSKLKSPLKKVHITHNIKEVTVKETGKSTGYIYFINAKDIKEDLSLFVTNDPDREVIYHGDKPLDIIKVIPHTLEWECSYDPENEKHHGPATKNRGSIKEENGMENSMNETNFLSNIFNKPKAIANTVVYDISAEDYIQKYHLKNFNKAKELQPKLISIISKKYPELLRKKVFEKSDLSDYKNLELEDLNAYIDYKDNISYPLVDWDLWKFTPKARDNEESEKFWEIYTDITNQFKLLLKNDKDYLIEDGGDWDGGSICLTYKKTIAKPIQSNYVQENGILIMEGSKPERLFKCPFCNERTTRVKLVDHIENEHEDMIPQDHTAARVVFNYINKKDHGNCVQCGKETQWNDDAWRYDRYCSEACMKEYVAIAKARMVKTYGKAYILDEPDHQQKMLKGRGISGEYKFDDGGVRSYCGTFEKKLLEFLNSDKFNAKSVDVQTPGPVIEYEYKGEKHFWITDLYYSPANLVFDVKDGGDNPNTRDMPEYRAKQDAKEAAIIKQGKYNYIRLTNNNFVQLFYILAEIRERLMDDNETPVVHINEYMSIGAANPVVGMDNTAYVVPCMIGNTLVDLAYCKDSYYKDLYMVDDGKIVKTTKDFLEGMYNLSLYKYNGDDALQVIEDIGENIRANNVVEVNYFYNKFSGKEMLSNNQFFFDESFTKVKDDYQIGTIRQSIVQESFDHQYREALGKNIYFPIINPRLKSIKENALKDYDNLEIYQDTNGYFVYDTVKNNRTVSFSELYNIDLDILGILSSM